MIGYTKHTWSEDVRYDYPLMEKSVVVDAGAYMGDFSARIHEKFQCRILAMEPVPEFYAMVHGKLHALKSDKIHLVMAGLSDRTERVAMNINGDATSRFGPHRDSRLCDFTTPNWMFQFIARNFAACEIDLLKMNIEGSEYDVLENILATDMAKNIRFIQVQFHPGCSEHDEVRLNNIRMGLEFAHQCDWRYQCDHIWESWSRK